MENIENKLYSYLDGDKIHLIIDGVEHVLTENKALSLRAEMFKAIGDLRQDKQLKILDKWNKNDNNEI